MSRGRSRGQAMVEFALVLPIAVVILALVATGGQMLMAAIDLTQAARAGAQAVQGDLQQGDPASQQLADARSAVEGELGVTSLNCGGKGASGQCVTVTTPATSGPGQTLATVTVWRSVDSFLPVFGSTWTISAQATTDG